MSGIDAIAAIRGRIPSAQAIVLTTYTGEEDVYQSLRAGAKGYLLKDAPREDLLGCIRAVHEGRTWISPQAAAHLAVRLNAPQLSPRELEVLRSMATGRVGKQWSGALCDGKDHQNACQPHFEKSSMPMDAQKPSAGQSSVALYP